MDCPRCPRLVAFRAANREKYPGWFNNPVPSFGDPEAWLLIVGLAPGLQGANRTGRPFTGDWAGDLLFSTLETYGFTSGTYDRANGQDDFRLHGALISNAVHCVPPENKPLPAEIHNCRPFLDAQVKVLPNVRVMLALGQIAHAAAVKAGGGKLPKNPFGHGAIHRLPKGLIVADSYHCSRYNTNTGRLTTAMFHQVFEQVLALKAVGF